MPVPGRGKRARLSEKAAPAFKPQPAPRVVFDTNVVVSALIFKAGRVPPVRAVWRSRRATPLVSRATTTELLRVLAYPKFKLAVEEINELLHDFLPFAEVVAIPEPAPRTPRCRDPKDLPFLELAIAAGADALVTGDLDLLALSDKLPVPVLSPEKWLSSF